MIKNRKDAGTSMSGTKSQNSMRMLEQLLQTCPHSQNDKGKQGHDLLQKKR